MKNAFMFFIVTMLVSSSIAQLTNTRWKTTLRINSDDINSIIDFRKDTVLLYTVADSTMIERMTYTKDDSSFTLLKIDGQSDCNNTPGQYRFVIKGDSLTMKLIKDDCYDRYNVIENTVWSTWKDYPGVQVADAILQKYTGVYGVDQAHPITVTLENGVLYAEGPNNNLPKSAFIPLTESTFLLRVAGVKMDFIKDANGKVIKIISHEAKDYELTRIK